MDELVGFRRYLQQRTAERVAPTANGTAFLSPSIRHVYDHNYLSVEHAGVSAETLAAEADEAMADCFHRRVVVEDARPGLASEFVSLGYVLSTHLVLAHGRKPDRRIDTAMIRRVALDDLLSARMVATLREPWGDEEIAVQLNEAKRHIADAVSTRFFGAFDAGALAGWCELRVHDGVAQIEDVEVLQEFRGLGLGRALVQHALDEGTAAAKVVFLEALADDWPRELYAKLGFVPAGARDVYTKLPHPLTRLRLRTPLFELRLPTVAELRRLYRVAESRIDEETFLEYHRERQELVVFLDGEPIGAQGVSLDGDRAVTGSWLGLAHQGKGYETEMRAAVLTYAFDHLGARVARSGRLERNAQSNGVSVDVELRAEDFVSPVPVEIAGVM